MIEKKLKMKRHLIEFIFYISIFCFTFISYIIFKPLQSAIRNGVMAQIYSLSLVTITITIFIILKKHNKLNENITILLLILISYFIHLGYMLYTQYDCRQYDTIVDAMDGHEGYAYTIFSTGKLPNSNNYQFYHPPLNAFIQSCFMHFSENILLLFKNKFDTSNIHVLYQSCQILSVFYTTIISVISYKILKILNIKGKGLIIGFIFICFFPRFIQLSGQLNNDLICILFCFLSIYYTLKWYHNKTFLNIILLAVFIGLAMCSKISGAVICITPAIIFIISYIQVIKSKNKKQIIDLSLKYIVFLLICAPIGLWFQVYAYIRFHQPLGFVFHNLNGALSTSHHNFFERFLLIINFDEMFSHIYCHPFDDYGLFNYILKSAIFGEFSYWQGESFAFLAILFNYAFVFTSLVLFIKYFLNSKKEDILIKITSLSIIISQIISMIYFNLTMPYGCTMDFRYIVPIVIGYGILFGASHNKLQEIKKNKYLTIVTYISLGFILFSNLFYFVCI